MYKNLGTKIAGFGYFMAAVALPLGSAWAAQTATLKILSGKVQVMVSGQVAWSVISAESSILNQGDRVRTSNKAKAQILMKDGSQIELSPSSVFLVDFLEEKKMRFKLDFGKLRALVSKGVKRDFSIASPVAVCAVRGTEFEVGVDPSNQHTAIDVIEGVVAVSDNKGSEVLLNAGQSVAVTQEGLGRPSGQGGQQSSSGDKAKQDIAREVRLDMSREAVEAAAALEMKNAVAQDGKAVIDAFGKHVQTESYIVPNAAEKKISWVVLNTRDENFNYGRFDVWLNREVPASFNGNFLSELYYKSGSEAPTTWALKDQWFMSNTQDYWIKAHAGGNPVRFTTPGNTWFETIFDHSYTAISENGQTRLLEHYISAGGVKDANATLLAGVRGAADAVYGCVPGAAASCMDQASPAYGNHPSELYYDYYEGADAGVIIGDQGGQLQTLTSSDVNGINTAFASREGYYNKLTANPAALDLAKTSQEIHVTNTNAFGTANAAGVGFTQAVDSKNRSLIVTYDDYLINDEGKTLTVGDFSKSGVSMTAFRDRTNYEFVTVSPTFSSKVDLVIPIRILNSLDSANSRPSS